MKLKIFGFIGLLFMTLSPQAAAAVEGAGVRIKDLCRLTTARDNSLVGYGIVTGLAGTGDSARSGATLQSIKNILLGFGVNVPVNEVRSLNAAAVMVTATLPPYAQQGDKLDINVSSMGDARSLLGGTLLLTHLTGADRKIYALAQGPLSVGGFSYDLNGNLIQKNHATAASVPGGAIVERGADTVLLDADGALHFNLYEPDFATASRVVDALDKVLGTGKAQALDAARIKVTVPQSERTDVVGFLSRIESATVTPDLPARVVVNERTGTVVAGGDIRIAPVTISHGDLNVAISTEFTVSQPFLVVDTGRGVRTEVVPQTDISVDEEAPINVSLPSQSTVGELVAALNKVKASSRDIITILQGIKRAGALHAELIIQ
jgi:flagellar P-ring protein precursor FlgI